MDPLSPSNILQLLDSRGISIRVHEAALRCSPKHLLTSEIRDLIARHKPEIFSFLTEQEQEGARNWHSLLGSGKTDMDVTYLDEALFLFAAEKIRTASDEAMWNRYAPFWEKRLPHQAMKALETLRQELASAPAQRPPEQILMQERSRSETPDESNHPHTGPSTPCDTTPSASHSPPVLP